MVEAQQLRDGLFSISWHNPNARPSDHIFSKDVTNFKEIFQFCQLHYKVVGQNIILEMQIQLAKKWKQEKMIVHATKDGVRQKLSLVESKWTASWNGHVNNCSRGCRPSQQFYGVGEYQRHCGSCGSYSVPVSKVGFEILIDLFPDREASEQKKAHHVLDHLLYLWESKTLSDVTFKCKGTSIKAHSMILASASSVLAATFQNDFEESKDRIVEIKDINPHILERLLRYVYTGEAAADGKIPDEDVEELLTAADKYAIESLKKECAAHMSEILSVENATRFLLLAHLHNLTKLYESSLDFMKKNKAVCSHMNWMDLMKNYPELCFQATQLIVGL